MPTLTGVAGTLPLPGIATVAAPGTGVTSGDQQVTTQQLLNQDATLEAALINPDPERPTDGATLLVPAAFAPAGRITVVQLPNPSSDHIAKLRTTTAPIPADGAQVLLAIPPGLADGVYWHVKREDGTQIADLYADTYPGVVGGGIPSWVLCQFEGGVWRGVIGGGTIEYFVGW